MKIVNLPPADAGLETSAPMRLPVATVERLHRSVGGDPITEEFVLRFIGVHWNARNLFQIPAKVAQQILQRPADFIRAAKQHFEPELTL